MDKEEQQAIEKLKNREAFKFDYECKKCGATSSVVIPQEVFDGREIDIVLNLIDKQQEELDKKDKVINLMAEKLVEDSDVFNYQHSMTEEKWKEYFYKEVEEENE